METFYPLHLTITKIIVDPDHRHIVFRCGCVVLVDENNNVLRGSAASCHYHRKDLYE